MRFKRKIAALIAAATLLTTSTAVTAYADNTAVHEPMPCYELLGSTVPALLIDGNTAYCETVVHGDPSVININVVQKLQKYWGLWIWNDVSGATWSRTVNDNYLTLAKSRDLTESGKYRVQVEITLESSDGTKETVTVYSKEVDVTI